MSGTESGKKKMRSKIFWALVSVSLIAMLLIVPVSLLLYYHVYEDRIEEDLLVELMYAEALYNEKGIKDFSLEGGRRVTVISADGTVLYDSVAGEDNLDNHLEREEVKEALENGIGMSERKSETLSKKSVYCASRLTDGNILRLSTEAKTVFSFLSLIILPLVLVIAVVAVIVLFLSGFISKKIVEPVNELNLENPDENDTYEELSPLLLRLKKEKDNTKRELEKSEEKRREFELISSSLDEGLAIVNRDGILLSKNESFMSLLGKNEKESGSVFAYFDEGDGKKAVLSALSGVKGEVTLSVDKKMIECVAYPSDKKGCIILLRDVTERVERETMRREFTANVSHELKTPLTTISGFAELLMSGNVPFDKVVDFSSDIYKEAQRLISLVSDILNLSSLDEKSEKCDERVNVKESAEAVISELEFKASNKNVDITASLEDGVIIGSEKLLGEVIYNLLDNAIRYNQSEEPWVRVETKKEDNRIVISVSDNGIGIAPSEQERIFERFYRVDKARSKSTGGTGLGLSIVKNAVMRMNGDIKLSSELGRGTVIRVSFPPAD